MKETSLILPSVLAVLPSVLALQVAGLSKFYDVDIFMKQKPFWFI